MISLIGKAHGLMVLWGGKHGNSSNFADPLGALRLEDRSSELKLVYRQILNVFWHKNIETIQNLVSLF